MYRSNLPQSQNSRSLFVTDGGLETVLIFEQGFELPEFASFVLMDSETGKKYLEDYYRTYLDLARENGVGIIVETPTWRASKDYGEKINAEKYTPHKMFELNVLGAEIIQSLRSDYETDDTKIVISGSIGPRSDGYNPSSFMSVEEAKEYHTPQIEAFKESAADFVTALTLTYPSEAIGICQASNEIGMKVVIAFTVETDGKLPNGQDLLSAIEEVDAAAQVEYFMINCAHPTHFSTVFETGSHDVLRRILGLKVNASQKSHSELDKCNELDSGNPQELAEEVRNLRSAHPHLTICGGCCGTNHLHIAEICS